MGCCFLPQGIFPTQGSNLCLLHYRPILYRWTIRKTLQLLLQLLNSAVVVWEQSLTKWIWVGWLCLSKTLFRKTGNRLDLAPGYSLPAPGLGNCEKHTITRQRATTHKNLERILKGTPLPVGNPVGFNIFSVPCYPLWKTLGWLSNLRISDKTLPLSFAPWIKSRISYLYKHSVYIFLSFLIHWNVSWKFLDFHETSGFHPWLHIRINWRIF